MRLPDGWRLTPYRAVVHQPTRAAIIADLHLGYAAARRAVGDALPICLPGPMLTRLRQLTHACRLKRIIVAGDLVERGRIGSGAAQAFVKHLADLQLELHHVSGNHDCGLRDVAGFVHHGDELTWAGVRIVHYEVAQRGRFTIMGHLHPVLRDVQRLGQAPCYLHLANQLLLPAQSDDAAGANVLAMKALQRAECFAIVGNEVLDLGRVSSLRNALASSAGSPGSCGRRLI